MRAAFALLMAFGLAAASAEVLVTKGLLPLGDLTTEDQDGPYIIPQVQAAEVEGALAAKTGVRGFTDFDVLNFLANTECLEANFDTYAAFGYIIPDDLLLGGGPILGGKRANLSNEMQPWVEEVALNEQGHVRMIREVLGRRSVPCPKIDLIGGFDGLFKKALGYKGEGDFNPYLNDVNFLVSMWTLEEIGSTGDKGSVLLVSNPGIANAIGGLAGSASFQSGVDRLMLWQRRNETVEPFGVSVEVMVQAISDLRDNLDGPLESDQGITNNNTNLIAVPTDSINLAPTDIRGLTFSRTPQQVLHILTLGSPTSKGGFFPDGVNGRINSSVGYNVSANAYKGYSGNKVVVKSLKEAGEEDRLGKNITVPKPAPEAVQLEASGRQYPGFTRPSQLPYCALYKNGTIDGTENTDDTVAAPKACMGGAPEGTTAPESGAAPMGAAAPMGGGMAYTPAYATAIGGSGRKLRM